MKKYKYVKCAKCGKIDKPAKPVIEGGVITVPYNVGTAEIMRCSDCCGDSSYGYALRCRDCCPTGHGTRFDTEG